MKRHWNSFLRVGALTAGIAVVLSMGSPAFAADGNSGVPAGAPLRAQAPTANGPSAASTMGSTPLSSQAIAAEGRVKRAMDNDPHVPLSSKQQRELAQKNKTAADAMAKKKTGISAQAYSATIGNAWQFPQTTNYYCGPSTLLTVTTNRNVYLSWDTAADILNTTSDDTRWTDYRAREDWSVQANGFATGHPMQDAINYALWTNYYYQQEVSLNFPQSSVDSFKNALVYDVDNNWGVAGNVWEVASGTFHLYGHPTDRTIFHWISFYGYENYGNNVWYIDPAGAGAVSSNWSAPRWASYGAYGMVDLLSGRGYVW